MAQVKEVIEYILRNEKIARNSDKYLTMRVYQELGYNSFTDLLRPDCPSPETIRRSRQKFQEDGKYMPDKVVKSARKANEERIYCELINGIFTGLNQEL